MVASILGKDIDTGELVTLEQNKRLGGTYVIGKTGSGKTTLLVNMILQDIKQGMGLCFIDVHGDAITDILKRLPPHREHDVILLNPFDEDYAFGLNLFHCENPQDNKERSRTVSYVMQVFAKLFAEGDLAKNAPNMAQTLQNAAFTLIEHQHPKMTMAEIPLLIRDETARTRLTDPITNAFVAGFWRDYNRWRPERQGEMTASTLTRVGNFLADPLIQQIVGQSETTLKFRAIVDSGKILLVQLDANLEQITSLIGSVIVGQLLNAALSRKDTPEEQRKQFNLYADEYQRFATPDFATLLAEVRKYKIATTIAHQFRDQLDEKNKGATLNAANLVVYQVSGADAEELAKQFDCTPPPAETRPEVKLTPVSNPFDWLVSGNTHTNPVVNQFMDTHLRKIHLTLTSTLGKFGNEIEEEKALLSELNSLLYRAMTSSDALSMLCEKSSLSFLLRLHDKYPFGKFYFDRTVVGMPDVELEKFIWSNRDEVMERQKYLRRDQVSLYEVVTGSIEMPVLFPVRVRNKAYTVDEQMIIALIAMIQALGENQFHQASANFARLAEEKLRKRLAVYLAKYQQAYEKNRSKVSYFNPILNIAYWETGGAWSVNKGLSPEQVAEYWNKEFERWITEERAAFETFLREFRDFILALAKEPITSGSGIYEEKPVTQRTFADMEKEVAKRLANPKEYTARCKLGTREYSILPEKTEAFIPAVAPYVVQDRVERIIAQTRATYCKRRTDVEQEIAARQETLTRPIQRKPQTKQEEA